MSTAEHLKTARKRCRGVASASFMTVLKVRKAQELKELFNTFSKHNQKDVFVGVIEGITYTRHSWNHKTVRCFCVGVGSWEEHKCAWWDTQSNKRR